MAFTETSNQSWFGRIGGAFKGILFGGLMFLIAFPLQFWNEGRAVRRIKTLAEGKGAVLADVAVDSVSSSNDGKLVHMIGEATADGTLTDPKFAVSVENALKLKRHVEMYQWHEDVDTKTRKKTGGGKTTEKTYSYYKDWSDSPINSEDFNDRGRSEYGDGNPPMPFQSDVQTASKVGVGAFELNDSLISMINSFESLDVSDQYEQLPEELKKTAEQYLGGYFLGNNPKEPQIGDLKINFEVIRPTIVSFISEQTGKSFRPYAAKSVSGTIERLEVGKHSVDEMFKHMEAENTMLTWLLRAAGLALMVVGVGLIMSPLVVMADVVPFIGRIVGAGVWLIALLIGAFFSFTTISIAWIFYRPLIGISLLAVSAVCVFFIYKQTAKPASKGFADDVISSDDIKVVS